MEHKHGQKIASNEDGDTRVDTGVKRLDELDEEQIMKHM